MTNRTAVGVLLAGMLFLAGGALSFCEACNAAEVQEVKRAETAIETGAAKLEPWLTLACTVAADVPPIAGAVDLVCPEAELADKAIAALAQSGVQAKVVAKTTAADPARDGALVTLYRVRCQLAAAPSDGGGA